MLVRRKRGIDKLRLVGDGCTTYVTVVGERDEGSVLRLSQRRLQHKKNRTDDRGK